MRTFRFLPLSAFLMGLNSNQLNSAVLDFKLSLSHIGYGGFMGIAILWVLKKRDGRQLTDAGHADWVPTFLLQLPT